MRQLVKILYEGAVVSMYDFSFFTESYSVNFA